MPTKLLIVWWALLFNLNQTVNLERDFTTKVEESASE